MTVGCDFLPADFLAADFLVCVTATAPTRRVIIRTEPAIRPLPLSGETFATPFTVPARVIVNPRVGAETYATAYTESAAIMPRGTAPASIRMNAVLSGYAIDQGEFTAGMVLVDEDVENLVLLGVI